MTFLAALLLFAQTPAPTTPSVAPTAQAPKTPSAAPTPLPKKDLPIHVKGGSFQYVPQKDEGGKLVFTGGVNVKQGAATASSDRLTGFVDSLTREVSSAVAEGNVRLKEGNRVAVSNRAEFQRKTNKIVLTGQARLWENGNVVEGKRITFDLVTGTVDCHKCRLVIDPDELGDTLKDLPGSKKKDDGKSKTEGAPNPL